MARTIAFVFLAVAAVLVLAGCTQGPAGDAVLPSGAANGNPAGAGSGTSATGTFPAFDQDGNIAVTLRLASDEIAVGLRVGAKDTNALAGICSDVCAFINYQKYRLQFDENRMYSCFCYREVCKDTESNGQILRTCSDEAKLLYFKAI